MIVTPNEYLDARRPDWLDAEMSDRVRYDALHRTVSVTDRTITAVLDRRQAF